MAALFIVISEVGYAQEKGTVYGHISSAASEDRLISAVIEVSEGSLRQTSNSAGYYELHLEEGTYTIAFSYLGYETLQKVVELTGGEKMQINVALTHADMHMDDFLVEAVTASRSDNNPGSMEVPAQYLNQTASMLHADLFRSIQLMPGVLAASDFSGGLHIRGGSPDQTLIQLDGTTVYNPTHFYGFYSTFNPDIVENVTLHKGTYPARYGGRLGSVVDVQNKAGNREHTGGAVNVGLLSSSAMIEGPHPAGSYLLAFRRSTLEPTLSVLRKTEESIPDSFHFYDLNASIRLNAGTKNKLDLTFYNSMDDLLFPVTDIQNFQLNYGNQTGALNWTHIISDKFFSTTSLSASRYANAPVFNYDHKTVEKQNQVSDYSGKTDIEWIPSRRSHFMAGISGGHIGYDLNEQTDAVETYHYNLHNFYTTAYLQAGHNLTDSWEISGGVRGSWYSRGNYIRAEPRLSLVWNLTSTSSLKAAAGRYYQFASLITTEAFNGFDMWLSTSDNVAPSYSNQFSLGYKNTIRDNYKLELGAYYRSMHDLFELDPFGGSLAGRPYEDLFYYGDGFAAGLEFFLSKYTGMITGLISYTLGTTQKRIPEVNDNMFFPPKYDRLHNASAVGNINLFGNWKLSAVFSYGSGQPYTEPLGWVVLNDEVEAAYQNPIIVGNVNASRLPAYHRLDLGISRHDTLFGHIGSELKLEVVNIYSRRNIWFYNYRFDGTVSQREAVTMLPMVPSISYALKF